MPPTLAIVIHTEEEFDWDGGFYQHHDTVTHANALQTLVVKMVDLGAKVTLALDYAFVNSENGQQALAYLLDNYPESIEIATHLHPWVSPPFYNENSKIDEKDSYPGNLPAEQELAKLQTLTDKIIQVTGRKPTTYLAGRYGIGANSYSILKQLGYTTDVSISPYANFTHQQGPDFSRYNTSVFTQDELRHIPHTSGIISAIPWCAKYYFNHPEKYQAHRKTLAGRLLHKILRVKLQRLSPEGFSLQDMQKLTTTLLDNGQQHFILSFHSPSADVGKTPYVLDSRMHLQFTNDVLSFLKWWGVAMGSRSFSLTNQQK